MRIILAGYNLDTEVINELRKTCGDRKDITPETLSASYARISRDPRPVDELRAVARKEVEQARTSNRTIIFKMGHHSIAEHAVFNFDIIGVSRLAIEELEKFRLCSYTEKSQRYITLGNDFVIPEKIKGSSFKNDFIRVIHLQNSLYHTLYPALKDHVFQKFSHRAHGQKNHNTLDGWAKEDARYITSLATEGQLGMTMNARNLELLFRRFASHPAAEIQEIGRKLYDAVKDIAPSIILFTEANDYDQNTYPALRELTEKTISEYADDLSDTDSGGTDPVELLTYTQDADLRILASLMHTSSHLPYSRCLHMARKMDAEEKRNYIKNACRYMEFYDAPLREFEHVQLTYNLLLSASCFAQLKRHRLTTITQQPYDPHLGVTIPTAITAVGMTEEFLSVTRQTEEHYYRLKEQFSSSIASYVLTNAHRRRVLFTLNARELYHISRLREDAHAQWEIREMAGLMVRRAREVMPLTLLLIGGKDTYPHIYQEIFGTSPKALTPAP